MIDKNYIKMCEKAEEIQKQIFPKLSFVIVKKCWATRKREIGIITDIKEEYKRYNIFMKNNPYGGVEQEFVVWLPTQEQLQEMINWKDYHISICWNCLPYKFEWSQDPLKIDGVNGNSMNELWLAFVMKEKYNKIWTGRDWVKL